MFANKNPVQISKEWIHKWRFFRCLSGVLLMALLHVTVSKSPNTKWLHSGLAMQSRPHSWLVAVLLGAFPLSSLVVVLKRNLYRSSSGKSQLIRHLNPPSPGFQSVKFSASARCIKDNNVIPNRMYIEDIFTFVILTTPVYTLTTRINIIKLMISTVSNVGERRVK
jgi:hypothetical protein